MAQFFVGQRVRIKWCHTLPDLAGREGTIVGAADHARWPTNADGRADYWLVRPDGWESSFSAEYARHFGPSSDQLEPLTDSNTLVSWESMRGLWVPERLREVA